MGKTLTEMTADIVLAQSKITKMSPIELANLLDRTYRSLKDVAEKEAAVPAKESETEEKTPAMEPSASIQRSRTYEEIDFLNSLFDMGNRKIRV